MTHFKHKLQGACGSADANVYFINEARFRNIRQLFQEQEQMRDARDLLVALTRVAISANCKRAGARPPTASGGKWGASMSDSVSTPTGAACASALVASGCASASGIAPVPVSQAAMEVARVLRMSQQAPLPLSCLEFHGFGMCRFGGPSASKQRVGQADAFVRLCVAWQQPSRRSCMCLPLVAP